MMTKIRMKTSLSRCQQKEWDGEKRRKATHKSDEKDKLTSRRHEEESDQTAQTHSMMARTGALTSWFIQQELADSLGHRF